MRSVRPPPFGQAGRGETKAERSRLVLSGAEQPLLLHLHAPSLKVHPRRFRSEGPVPGVHSNGNPGRALRGSVHPCLRGVEGCLWSVALPRSCSSLHLLTVSRCFRYPPFRSSQLGRPFFCYSQSVWFVFSFATPAFRFHTLKSFFSDRRDRSNISNASNGSGRLY